MLSLIIRKELRDIIGSAKFALTFGVCSVLIILSFYVGARNYQVSREQYEAATRENLRKLEGLNDWVSVRDFRVYLPPQPIASIVMGVSNDIGRTAEIRGRGEIRPDDNRYGDDPVYAVFRFLDLDFVFQIVLSLFAILFAYDAVSGEKERGTLRLSFANAVPRGTYIIGKLLGSFVGAGLPLLIPILIGLLILILMGVPMAATDWVRLILVVTAGTLYFAAFLGIAVFVSTITQRSSNSFLILLAVWILAVLVWPRTAVLLAGRAVSVPGVDDLNSQKGRYNISLWEEDRKKMANFRAPEGVPMDKMMAEFQKFMGSLGDEREKKMSEFTARLNEERSNRLQVQERLALGLARISPAAVVSLASMEIAGTGVHMQEAYVEAAQRYQKTYAEFMKQKTGMNVGGGFVFRVTTDSEEEKKPINVQEIPSFEFQPPALSASLGAVAVDLGLLALTTLLSFAAAFVGFLRYDVR
jgi:ABC-type transport system involved in multi-copper enzyme maturation permease subunit